MTYDRDLRWARRATFVTIAVIAFCAISYYDARNWPYILSSAMWMLCGCVWLAHIRSQQRTRDCVREFEAVLHEWMREVAENSEQL